MTDIKLYILLDFLKERNINIDIDSTELALLDDDLVDKLKKIESTYDIVSILIDEIIKLRTKVRESKEINLLNDWEKEHKNTEAIAEPSEKSMIFRTKEKAIKLYAADQRTK